MVVFQGHQVFPGGLFVDLLQCFLPIVLFLFLQKIGQLPKIGRHMRFIDYLLCFSFLLFLPNTTYAFLEIKHLFVIDHIADTPSIMSWIVLGGVSIFGLVCTLLINWLIVRHYAQKTREVPQYYIGLSLIAGFGSVVGLMDLYSWQGCMPSVILKILHTFLLQPHLTIFALSLSLLIFLLGYIPHILFSKPSV